MTRYAYFTLFSREKKSEIWNAFTLSEKWKVIFFPFTHFESEKWNENALKSRSRMKSEMKMPRDRDREVKLEKNSREFSRNETLAGYCRELIFIHFYPLPFILIHIFIHFCTRLVFHVSQLYPFNPILSIFSSILFNFIHFCHLQRRTQTTWGKQAYFHWILKSFKVEIKKRNLFSLFPLCGRAAPWCKIWPLFKEKNQTERHESLGSLIFQNSFFIVYCMWYIIYIWKLKFLIFTETVFP